MSKNTNASSGIGFWGLLFIVLLALKLSGAANISWWLVFSPFIICAVFIFVVLLIYFIIVFVERIW